jgi:hypothetical protein
MVVQLHYLKKNVFIGSGLSVCVGVVFGTLFRFEKKKEKKRANYKHTDINTQ